MTAFLTEPTSYHTSLGFVHIIPRPSLGLGKVADGKIVNLLTNFDKADKPRWHCEYLVLFKPAKKAQAVYVVLGCGATLKFSYEAFEYMQGEGGRSGVEFDRCELVQELLLEIEIDDSHLEAFVL